MTSYGSFGRVVPAADRALPANEAIDRLRAGVAGRGSLLAYGNGRSYGDSCQNSTGSLIEMRGRNRLLRFDAETGVLEAEAGMLLADVIRHAAPSGYFPAVVPGTQLVTLGGAIANDVHGKNHHRRGTFGTHVVSLTLLRSDGRLFDCSPLRNADLFAATIGGMGMTGLILAATIRLMAVPSLDIEERVTPFAGLDQYFDLACAADKTNEYSVAWVDQLASGRHTGRGLLFTGNHAETGSRSTAADPHRSPSVFFQPPVGLLNRPVLRAFNALYRRHTGRRAGVHQLDYRSFFFPLDAVGHWNRLYGPGGLHQHQSVVPDDTARRAIPALLEAGRAAGQGSFLTVLKRFGSLASPGSISFPRAGYTLTLDFPHRGDATLALLDRLDAIALDAGGAVNPYKDARMSAAVFDRSLPGWPKVEALRDPAFLSDFWRRAALDPSARSSSSSRGACKSQLLSE